MDREPQTKEEIDAERAKELKILEDATKAANALLAEKAAATRETPTKKPITAPTPVTPKPKTPSVVEKIKPNERETQIDKEIDELLRTDLKDWLTEEKFKEISDRITRLEAVATNENQRNILKTITSWLFEEKERTTTKRIEPTPAEKKEIKDQLDKLPEEEKTKIATGLNNIGFKLEQKKGEFFARIIGKLLEHNPEKEARETTTVRFLSALQTSFTKDAKAAEQKAEDAATGKKMRRFSNAGLLVGNIAKYGRIISDFTTHSMASPLRYVMMVGAFGARSADAAKEARLSNEEVINETRIKDIDKAAEEAWQIYRNAMAENEKQEVSANGLKKAYIDRMPKDLMERLSRDSGMGILTVQGFIKADLGGAIKRLNKKIEEIEGNDELNGEQKEHQKQMLLREQERNLMDYDRILTQYGTVDGLAMAGRYAKAAGNAVIWATTVETIALSVEKLWGNLAHMLAHEDSHKAGAVIAKIVTHKDSIHAPNADTSHILKPDSVGNIDSTTTTEVVVGAQPHAPEVVGFHPGYDLDKATEFKVGSPADLEHTYEKLLLSHNLPQHDLKGANIVLDKIAAGKTLNEAANMLRLTEGNGAAGITAEEFAKYVKFDGKILHILDAKGLNSVMERVHEHSGAIDTSGAEKYGGNVNWLEKVHAEHMQGDVEHPGILGHTEVESQQIGEMPEPYSPEDVARAKVSSLYEELQGRAPINNALENPQNINWVDRAETITTNPAPMENNVLDPNNPMFQEHMAGAMEGKPVIDATYNPYEDMSRVWSPEDAKIAYENTIQHLYPQDHGYVYNGNWLIAKDTPALEIFNANMPPDDVVYGPVVDQMHKIEEVTGLIPKGETWFRSAETVAKFIMRGTQKAAEMGTAAMQKIRATE